MKTILLIIKIKKTADNKRTFVQFVFAYWQVVVVISGPELNRELREKMVQIMNIFQGLTE